MIGPSMLEAHLKPTVEVDLVQVTSVDTSNVS